MTAGSKFDLFFLFQAPVISDVPTSVSVGEVETTSRLIYTITANDPDGDPILCDVQSLVPADGYFVVTKSTETGSKLMK